MPLNPLPRNLRVEASPGADRYLDFASSCLSAVAALERWIAAGAPEADVIEETVGQLNRLRGVLIAAGVRPELLDHGNASNG